MADAPSCALLGGVLRARARDRAREAELALALTPTTLLFAPSCTQGQPSDGSDGCGLFRGAKNPRNQEPRAVFISKQLPACRRDQTPRGDCSVIPYLPPEPLTSSGITRHAESLHCPPLTATNDALGPHPLQS